MAAIETIIATSTCVLFIIQTPNVPLVPKGYPLQSTKGIVTDRFFCFLTRINSHQVQTLYSAERVGDVVAVPCRRTYSPDQPGSMCKRLGFQTSNSQCTSTVHVTALSIVEPTTHTYIAAKISVSERTAPPISQRKHRTLFA